MVKKRKDKHKPRPVKVNLEALLPKPGPISLAGPRRILENARQYPLLGCWIMQGWRESGLAPVTVARLQAENLVIFGNYLVDFYCLGVKNAFCNANFPRKRLEKELDRLCHGAPEPIDPSLAHEMIYGSIAYAERWGFKPHKDYKLASFVLEPPETYPLTHNLEFGKDGKPFFVSGPYDNVEAILAQLARAAGEGNYHFMAGMGDIFD
jgi:hypothetical protein